MREVFCKKNPFQTINQESQSRDDEDCPCPRVERDTHSRGLASHGGDIPAALSPSAHGKGGQKEPGWLLRGGDGAFALVPAWEGQTWAQAPQGT